MSRGRQPFLKLICRSRGMTTPSIHNGQRHSLVSPCMIDDGPMKDVTLVAG